MEDSVQIADLCDDMPAAYKIADVVVHASTEPEGFGRVVAEAMAMGRPVIATDIGAPPEIIEEGRTGWLVPPGDAKALAIAIERELFDRGCMVCRVAPSAALALGELLTAGVLVVSSALQQPPAPADAFVLECEGETAASVCTKLERRKVLSRRGDGYTGGGGI